MTTRILAFMATSSPIGGVATWLDNISGGLSDDFKLVVGLVRGSQRNRPEIFCEYHRSLNTIEIDGRGLNREGRIRACLRTIRMVNPDIVLPLGVLDANDAVLREKSRSPGRYLVGRAQGNLPPMLADLEDYRDGLDHVVCVGAMTRRYLLDHAGFDSERVTHIPNGSRAVTTDHVESDSGTIRLGYVGRLTRGDKRVMDIPLLCAELRRRNLPFSLTVVGAGPCENELKQQLDQFGSSVRMVGALTSDEVFARILPQLDVLLLFSSSETFGIVLAEAMMNGVVPVTSRYIGFESEQLVVDGVHGLAFPVGAVAEAANAIEQLHDHPEELRRLSVNAREHATTNYSWDSCVSRWDQTFNAILDKPPTIPPARLCQLNLPARGRLDRLKVPAALTDVARRFRRAVFGPAQLPGEEEWPLFRRHHSADRLTRIQETCAKLESDQQQAAKT